LPSESRWQMQVKQYTPRNNLSPKEGDITIISSHANGFPKQLYEPFWDDLLTTLTIKNLKIRNIFITTSSHLSPSTRNPLIHDGSREPDTSRDLLLLVNHFRDEILHPIIGIGHSIGASQLASLSLMHPSLFTSLVLIEPIIGRNGTECGVERLALAAIKRRREWKTRAEAENYFLRAWGSWDPRVRERWNSSALIACDVNKSDGKTELAWDRLQELTSYMDTSELRYSADEKSGFEANSRKRSAVWTPYPPQIWERLTDLAVHTFFVCAEESGQASTASKGYWRESAGTNEKFWMRGFERRVELLEMKGVGHLMPMEAPGRCAEAVGSWISEEIKVWWKECAKNKKWREMQPEMKEKVVENWMASLKSRI